MKYYKFVNDKIQDQALQEAGITLGGIYPEDAELAFEEISYWATHHENTKKDWEEATEEEYRKQQAKERQIEEDYLSRQIPHPDEVWASQYQQTPLDLFLAVDDPIPTEFKKEDFPMWKCHKEVGALKIAKITNLPAPLGQYCPARLEFEGDYKPIDVDVHYMVKNKPKVGGYFVVYEDGYVSYSPAEAFEKGYTKLEA